MSTSEAVKENEEAFQRFWDLYWHQETTDEGLKKQWDAMWMCVNKACLNIAKSKCYNLRVRDLEDKAMDATMNVMNKIKSGTHPKKLSSFCYLYTIGQLWSKKEQRWDSMVNLDFITNNKAYSFEDNDILIFEDEEGETDE